MIEFTATKGFYLELGNMAQWLGLRYFKVPIPNTTHFSRSLDVPIPHIVDILRDAIKTSR